MLQNGGGKYAHHVIGWGSGDNGLSPFGGVHLLMISEMYLFKQI